MDDDRTWRRHVKQLRGIRAQTPKTTDNDDDCYGPVEKILLDPSNKTIAREQTGNESKTPTRPLAPPQPERVGIHEPNVNKDMRRSIRKR